MQVLYKIQGLIYSLHWKLYLLIYAYMLWLCCTFASTKFTYQDSPWGEKPKNDLIIREANCISSYCQKDSFSLFTTLIKGS